MEIGYRNAVLADAPLLERLFRDSFTDTFGHLYRREDLDAFLVARDVAGWEEELRDPAFTVRVAEADGETAGYVKIGPVSTPVKPQGTAIEVRQLYILPRWKGTGIAAALMDWALDEARRRGVEEVFLSVYSDNHRARRFYERYGFEEVGAYQFMVGSHADDERIMRLELIHV